MPSAILHLLGTGQREGTGIANIVAELARKLDRERYRIHAWFLGPEGPLKDEVHAAGAVARSLSWDRGTRDPLGALRFCRALRPQEFAIVHQHFGARSVRRVVRAASSARIVLHVHGSPEELGSKPHGLLTTGADVIIAASHAIARGIIGPSPQVIHAGIPVPFEAPRREANENLLIGAACRLAPVKNLIVLLHAIQKLSAEFPNLRLEIAGDGPQRGWLQQETHRLGISDRVQFLGWQTDMRRIYRKWDIFAMPSLEEGFGLAALEAMAEALPVVVSNVGGLPEVVDDGRSGFLVPVSDAMALADRLRALLVDRQLRLKMGIVGWERAKERFSADRMVSRFAELYDSLLTPNQ